MPNKIIQLLIVDDSAVACKFLQFIAESDPSIKVVGTCSDGQEALDFLKKHTPDVILMDIHMPNMDGFEATRKIMSDKPVPIIICSADFTAKDTLKSFQALEAGALAILEKPPSQQNSRYHKSVKEFIDTIKKVSEIKLVTRKTFTSPVKTAPPIQDPVPNRIIEAIAIGASLGGPQALQTLFSRLPRQLPVPIFVAQHIAADFAEGLASWLTTSTGLDFVVPADGEIPEAGKVYIAPGCSTLELTKKGTFKIEKDINQEKISTTISTLFESIALRYGSRAIGIILTGMGRDGVDGLQAMKQKGALTIAQGAEDCLMFGMPKEAIQTNASMVTLNLKEMAPYLEKFLDRKKGSAA